MGSFTTVKILLLVAIVAAISMVVHVASHISSWSSTSGRVPSAWNASLFITVQGRDSAPRDDDSADTAPPPQRQSPHADVSGASPVGAEVIALANKIGGGPNVGPQQEPTTVPYDAANRFRNPYAAMRSSVRPCRNGNHTRGRWVRDESLKPLYPALGEILGCCQRGFEAAGHSASEVREEIKYKWEPDSCDLYEWNEELFCRSLRGRDIMIAGDSLNDHWHASLYYLLGGRKDIYKHEGTIKGKRSCRSHAICSKFYPKPLKLYFLTNQLLEEVRRLNRNYKWWKYMRPYPILVLNAGSWMRDPWNEERHVDDAEYARHMRRALAIVQRLYNGTVIWRTTYQGHPYCWKYQAPLTEELKDEDFPRVVPYVRYRWWAIPGRNAVATRMWKDAGAHILDVTRPTNLMPLGHLGKNHPKNAVKNITDCLHYCSPGPVYDLWSRLLMNLLAGNLDDRP